MPDGIAAGIAQLIRSKSPLQIESLGHGIALVASTLFGNEIPESQSVF